MQLCDVSWVAMEVGVVVDDVWVVVELSGQALTMEQSKLVILQLDLRRVLV